ncbi:ABC transporter permease [Bacteroidota bacterium]
MIWTYIRYTLRLFLRDRLHALITVLGLTIGLACGVIITIFVSNEISYESYHENAERIYRVSQNFITSGKPKKFAWSSPALGPKLFQEFPQIETFTRLKDVDRILFGFGDISFYEDHVAFADTNFFKVFTHEFIYGDPSTCLLSPSSMVLTESVSRKYFGEENPVGKEMLLLNRYPITVSAVIADPPSNTHFYNRIYISYLAWDMQAYPKSVDWSLFEIMDHTFLQFYDDFDREAFDAGWPEFYKKHVEEDAASYGQVYEPIFERITDIHYHSDLPTEYPLGNWSFFIAIVSVGIFLLLLAGINYTNLATARSYQRLRGISIQKVHGAGSGNLIIKLLLESVLMSLIALILAFGLVEYLLEFTDLADLLGLRLSGNLIKNGPALLGGFTVAGIIGLLSGAYPAAYLSRFSPLTGLRGMLARSSSVDRIIRKGLVVFQLLLAIVAITFTVLMKSQISFLENKDLGFKKGNVILVPARDTSFNSHIRIIQDELLGFPSVLSACNAFSYPGSPSGGLYVFEGDSGMEEHNLPVFFVDYNFTQTLDIELRSGRDFGLEYPGDKDNSILINEALARYMGWDDPIGKRISQGRGFNATVIGVVEDFHFRSLHHSLEPLMIRIQRDPGFNLMVRTSGQDNKIIIDYIENRFKELAPDLPFEYEFLDESFDRQYRRDEKHLRLISIFSALCIFVACLGLFTLVSYTAEKRTKEVGIRKVNGASTGQVIRLFIKDFFLLNIIALAISTPLIIWIFKAWLKEFPYQTDLKWTLFLMTYVLVLLITILTVLYHSVRAARSNPVNSLRYE